MRKSSFIWINWRNQQEHGSARFCFFSTFNCESNHLGSNASQEVINTCDCTYGKYHFLAEVLRLLHRERSVWAGNPSFLLFKVLN